MTDEPEIVKELRESEKLGRLQSKIQSAYEELDVVEEPSEEAPDKTIAFAGNTAERITEEDTTHYDVKTEKLYRSIVELSPDSIVTLDLKGVVTSCNSAGIKMMGYSRDEIVGKHFIKIGIFRARDNHKYLKLFVSVIKAKNFGLLEVEFRRKDGTTFLGEVRLTLLKEKGRPVGIMAITRDITDRKQIEGSLRESEEKFRNLAEESPNMIFINKNGRVVYANKKCEEIMGYKRDEFYSSDFSFLNLIASDCKKLIWGNFEKHNLGEDIPPYEYALITKKGKRIEAIITTKLITYENERAILGIVTDITEKKKTEEELKEKLSELETFHNIAVNREIKMIELKKEINELCKKYGEKPRYVEEAENIEVK